MVLSSSARAWIVLPRASTRWLKHDLAIQITEVIINLGKTQWRSQVCGEKTARLKCHFDADGIGQPADRFALKVPGINWNVVFCNDAGYLVELALLPLDG